jgi:hypothetical protein
MAPTFFETRLDSVIRHQSYSNVQKDASFLPIAMRDGDDAALAGLE